MCVSAIENKTYIGQIEVNGNDMSFHPEFTRSEFIEMGNVVYFMYVNGELQKIGIAAGKDGWYGRVGMYNKGMNKGGDATNARICRAMEQLGETTIKVYAVPVPKQKISFTNPVTGDIMETEVEVVREVEKDLTAKYLQAMSYSHEQPRECLLFSNQLS